MYEDDLGILGGENFATFRDRSQTIMDGDKSGFENLPLYQRLADSLEAKIAEVNSYSGFGKVNKPYTLTPEEEVNAHVFVVEELTAMLGIVRSEISRYNRDKEKAQTK